VKEEEAEAAVRNGVSRRVVRFRPLAPGLPRRIIIIIAIPLRLVHLFPAPRFVPPLLA